MLNTSTAYRKALLKDSKLFQQRIVITLTDNTEIILDNSKLWKGGLSFDEAVSADGVFEVGTAVIGSCSFTINNLDDTYTAYDFAKARVVPSLGLLLPDGTTEYLKKGEYIVDDTGYNGTTIRVSSLDKMSLFDRPYDTALAYPATLAQIVNDACLKCGVTLDANSTNFPHRTYSVAERPSSESTTYREVISYVAQIAGCFAKMNNNGYLTFKWFNQSAIETTPELRDRMADIADFVFNTYKAYSWEGLIKSAFINADGLTPTGIVNFSGIFSHTVNVDDVVITGVKVKYSIPGENTDSEYSTGTDGYVISIEGNALIQSAAQAKQVGDWLGSQLVGFRYRIASVSHLPDPTIEAGDVGFLIDRKGNVFPIIVSGTNFKPGATQSTRSSGATPARNSATRYSAETKNYVRLKEIIQEVDDYYQNGLDELSEALAGKGGLYTTIEAQPTGGNIYYLHDEPDLADSTVVWKMNNEAWGVSTDGGQTWNGGMTINGDVIARYLNADGVNANWIRTGIITDRNARNYWNLDTGAFSLQGVATDQDIQDAVDALEADLQTQIDSKINTFYQSADPSTGWTSDERTAHIGDLWYDTDTSVTYRWNGTTWQEQEVPDAISSAIESKSTIFYGSTSGTYTGVTTGDYLVDSSSGNTYRWNGSSWVKQTDYNTAINSAISTLRSDLETQIDGKINTFYQTTNPATNWTADEKVAHTGDLWYDSDDNVTYRWSGTQWQEQTVSDDVMSVINGKTTIYYGSPSGTYTGVQNGDYLVNSATGATYKWNGSSWVSQTDYASAITAYDTSLNQTAVFNKLTNNGETQGIYLNNNKLYVNASYIATGTLKDASNNTLFNLSTGDFTMGKGSITLGSNASSSNYYFHVSTTGAMQWKSANSSMSSTGVLSTTGANIKGTITTVNGNYKTVLQDGFAYFYANNSLIGKIGAASWTNIDTQQNYYGFDLDIPNGAQTGGFYLGTEQNASELWVYHRADSKWHSSKAIEIDIGDYYGVLSANAYGLTADGANIATQTWVTGTALSGYATQSWVQDKGYLTWSSLSAYATKTWVLNQDYLTSVPDKYATKSWVSTNTPGKGISQTVYIKNPSNNRDYELVFTGGTLQSYTAI